MLFLRIFNGIILVSPSHRSGLWQVRETFTRRKDRFLQMRNVTGPTQGWDFGFREAQWGVHDLRRRPHGRIFVHLSCRSTLNKCMIQADYFRLSR